MMMFISISVAASSSGISAYGQANQVVAPSASNSTSNISSDTLYISPGPSPAYVDNFNPFSPYNPPAGIVSLFYEPLYQIDSNNGTALPWLATSYSWNSNNTVLTFHLRKDVKFSNGVAFNSTDVAFTFNMEMKDLKEYTYISNVSAVGTYTVNFTLTHSDVPVFQYIASNFILPKAEWQNVSNPLKQVVTNPIGTGPYLLSSFSAQKIALVKNKNYWQAGEPRVSKIDYIDYTSNNALVLALSQGKVDWAPVFSPNITKLFVDKNPTYNHYFFPQGQPVTLLTNDMKYPFNQSFFRQAVSLSINRTQISKIGEYGYEQPANAAGILKQQEFWLNSTNKNLASSLATFNTTKAVSILEDHGYSIKSGRLYSPNGTELPAITLMTVAGYTDWDSDVAIISQNLQNIGLKVNIVTPTHNEVTQDIATGNFTMAQFVVTSAGPNPWYDYTGIGGNVPKIGQSALVNEMRWNSSGTNFINYYNEFSNTSNSNQQKTYINDMASIMLNQMPIIPLVYSADWFEYVNKTIGGFPNSNNNYWVPLSWSPGSMEVVTLHLYAKNNGNTANSGLPINDYYIIAGVVVAAIVIGGVSVALRRKGGKGGREKEE